MVVAEQQQLKIPVPRLSSLDVLSDHRPAPDAVVSYRGEGGQLWRSVKRREGAVVKRPFVAGWTGHGPVDPADAERAWLRSRRGAGHATGGISWTVVDLFAGCGGLSLGVVDALAALGETAQCLAVDVDETALAVYRRNLPAASTVGGDVLEVVDGAVGAPLTNAERALRARVDGRVFLIGGPPCQGHSAFNNRTRHSDSRNALYLRMVRAAEVLEADHVVIENVPGALNDRRQVVQSSVEALRGLGYETNVEIVDAAQLGVPQRRKRLVVVASRRALAHELLAGYRVPPRNVRWAIEDLQDVAPATLLDTPAVSAPQTRRRIARLFEDDLFELPDEERPPCHARGGHSYVSIYGRLRWDEPSQTITTGFYSMCMGRNVHPSRQRTITAHEAARLQGLPDYYDFRDVTKRSDLARLIGNAVPPKLGFAVALELTR